ncbi:MAG: polysaccharide deacetylase family protein [Candidatus Eisenbacteria bacterium]|nr:polysaccharide deacetylase family protein [Candidatus Eisenbacteria bacterium]
MPATSAPANRLRRRHRRRGRRRSAALCPARREAKMIRDSSLIAVLLLLACAAGAGESPPDSSESAVILQYHHIGRETPAATSVTPAQFAAHLSHLDAAGFAVWPLGRVVEHLQRGAAFPPRCVAITFDDAYDSVLSEAWPLLQARDWPCCIFVSSGAIDAGYAGFLDWAQMRELAAAGVCFANHSASHAHLVRRLTDESREAWAARMREEIGACQQRLRDELGAAPPFFAYPYGEYSPALREIVRQLDLIGFGQQSGAVWPGSDLGVLPRFPMSGAYAEMESFALKVHCRALPVLRADPQSPLRAMSDPPPVLRLHLADGDYRADQLAAYAGGERIRLVWTDREAGRLEVRAGEPLPPGRSRYNITAPERGGARYFWYSHLWIRGMEHND